MAIHHITFSSSGGAGRVAETLQKAQIRAGNDSRLHVFTDSNLWVNPLQFPVHTLTAALDQFVISNNKLSSTQFSLLRGSLKLNISQLNLSKEDIVHLHWMTGVLDPQKVAELSQKVKRIVWTLHDMEPITGGCHHSNNCDQYSHGCNACPQVNSIFRERVKKSFAQKIVQYENIANLSFVAPTQWMLNHAKNSLITAGKPLSKIPNPVSEDYVLVETERSELRKSLGLPVDAIVVILIAENLDDPNKQINKTVNLLLNKTKNTFVLLVGNTRNYDYQASSRIQTLGKLEPASVANYGRAADVHISMSKAESAGMTALEMNLVGTPSIVLGGSGMSEMILQKSTGIEVNNFQELLSVINTWSENKRGLIEMQKSCSEHAPYLNPNSKCIESYNVVYQKGIYSSAEDF